MPAALDIDREQIRMLYMELGAAETARKTGIPDGTIRQWAARGNWQAAFLPQRQLPPSIRPVTVTGVTKPADALAQILAEDRDATRLAASRNVKRAMQSYDDEDATTIRSEADRMKSLVTVAEKSQDWESGKPTPATMVSIQVLSL